MSMPNGSDVARSRMLRDSALDRRAMRYTVLVHYDAGGKTETPLTGDAAAVMREARRLAKWHGGRSFVLYRPEQIIVGGAVEAVAPLRVWPREYVRREDAESNARAGDDARQYVL